MTAMCVCKQLGAWPSRKVRSCENYCRHGTDDLYRSSSVDLSPRHSPSIWDHIQVARTQPPELDSKSASVLFEILLVEMLASQGEYG
jgi:hypothetical protein